MLSAMSSLTCTLGKILPTLLGIFVVALSIPVDGAIRYEKSFYKVSGEVVTPHIPWGKPLAGGKVRILIIAPRITMREAIELAQRLEVEHDEVMVWSSGTLGSTPNMPIYDQAEGAMVEDVEAELREKLRSSFDVILLGNVQWNILPKDVRDTILDKTRRGGGLIYAYPPKDWVKEMGVKELERSRGANRFLSQGIPFDALTAFEKLKGSKDPVSEFTDFYRLGKGRLAVLNYPHESIVVCLTAAPTAYGEHPDLEYEYLQSFVMKVILWAADRVPEVLISSMDVVPKPILWEQQDRVLLELNTENQGKELPVEVRWAVRDDMSDPMAEGSLDEQPGIYGGLSPS